MKLIFAAVLFASPAHATEWRDAGGYRVLRTAPHVDYDYSIGGKVRGCLVSEWPIEVPLGTLACDDGRYYQFDMDTDGNFIIEGNVLIRVPN